MVTVEVIRIICTVCRTLNEVDVEAMKGHKCPRCSHCGCPLKGLL